VLPTPTSFRTSAATALAAVLATTAAAVPLGTPAIAAESRSVVATADAYVSSSNANANYGASSSLYVDGSPVMRTYLRFDVPAAGELVRGRLQVYVARSSQAFQVRRVADTTWTEKSITYSNAPAVGSQVVTSGPVAKGSWAKIDVTSLLPSSGPVTLALTPVSGNSQAVASKESGTTRTPRLVLDHAGVTAVDTTAPQVSITSPLTGTRYTSDHTVNVTAGVSDNVGVTKVEFFDNGVYPGAEDTSPFS